jgi:methylglutaconyl-CoA hydratase
VNEVVAADHLDLTVERIVGELLKSAPGAIAAAKQLIRDLSGRPIEPALIDDTAQRIAALRTTGEAREGVGAFLEKRAPAWLS